MSTVVGSKSINIASEAISISFELVGDASQVAVVSYKISIDDYGYTTYIDETGLSRSHTFRLSDVGTLSSDSVINFAVGIEDLGGNVVFSKSSESLADGSESPTVSNLRTSQRTDGSGLVDIWYDYNDWKEIATAEVSLAASLKGVSLSTATAVGDIGSGVTSGQNRRIVWDPSTDAPTIQGSGVIFTISLTSESGETPSLGLVSGTFIIDTINPLMPPVVFKQEDEKERFGVYPGVDIKDQSISFVAIESSSSSSSSGL
jgi:hypothetical protein